MVLIQLLIAVIVFGYLLYKWSTEHYKVFQERGIGYKKPLPLVGNALPFVLNQQGSHKILLSLYQKHKHNKIYGYYNYRDPHFVICDPQIVKKLAVKNFHSFTNHQRFLNWDEDPLLRSMITILRDQRWKDMRNTLTPAFTGIKMRVMFNLMNECFDEAMKNLNSNLKTDKNGFEIELKDFFNRLSNDLIATTAFGIRLNSFVNRKNKFFTIGKSISEMKGSQAVKFHLFSMLPKLCKILGLSFFKIVDTNFFAKLVVETMKYREKHNIQRPDMIQLLIEAKKESAQHWTTEDLVAQCFMFFFAAFENNSNVLCTTCYELADNPDIQHRLYEEISDANNMLAGKPLDYETLKKLKYLDMVVHESLRKWPLTPVADRECGKDYQVTDEDGKVLCDLKKGDKIWFQIIGFHRDEDYFENPEIFDPERFSEENKRNIKPCTYIPFGVGPRNCIATCYALMQAKAMLFYLLKDYIVERSPKLSKNLMDDSQGHIVMPKGGYWFRLKKREQTSNL